MQIYAVPGGPGLAAEHRRAGTAPRVSAAFLAHRQGDDVAVAVTDVGAGEANVACLDTGAQFPVSVLGEIPLGHKVALRDLADGEPVTEYGVTIGLTRQPVAAGELVHTHNLRSARWQHSL
jgi:(2R)-sulfolactate sulfo-lyase subunit alpha